MIKRFMGQEQICWHITSLYYKKKLPHKYELKIKSNKLLSAACTYKLIEQFKNKEQQGRNINL